MSATVHIFPGDHWRDTTARVTRAGYLVHVTPGAGHLRAHPQADNFGRQKRPRHHGQYVGALPGGGPDGGDAA